MTSQWACPIPLGINKPVVYIVQAVCYVNNIFFFYSIAKLFSGNEKLIKKGENAVRSGHVLECAYDAEVGRIYGTVEASMKKTTYQPEVTCSLLRQDACWEGNAIGIISG